MGVGGLWGLQHSLGLKKKNKVIKQSIAKSKEKKKREKELYNIYLFNFLCKHVHAHTLI